MTSPEPKPTTQARIWSELLPRVRVAAAQAGVTQADWLSAAVLGALVAHDRDHANRAAIAHYDADVQAAVKPTATKQ